MKKVLLSNDKYVYLPSYNTLINHDLEKVFLKYSVDRQATFTNFKTSNEFIKKMSTKVNKIIFEVTQNCNLQCQYCAYSGSYDLNRKKTNKKINFEIIKMTLDYIYGVIGKRSKKELSIGFYGGEPLLEFSLIEKAVKYSKHLFTGWIINYRITTNGTLISDEILKFLIANNFITSISIDGPAEIHDEKRVFPSKEGSFDLVMNNIRRIKNFDSNYFFNKVLFSVVFSKDLSLMKVYKFFTKNNLIKKNSLKFSSVDENSTSYYDNLSIDKKSLSKDYENIFKLIIKKLKKNIKLTKFESALMKSNNIILSNLGNKNITTLSGSCIFDDKLYIDSNGKFHICEKMNPKFSIGDVFYGFDYKNMEKLVKEFTYLIREKCSDCEFKFLCNKCFVSLAKNGYFEINDEFCKSQKKTLKNQLEMSIKLNSGGLLN